MLPTNVDFPASLNTSDAAGDASRTPSDTEAGVKKSILYVPLNEKWLLTIPESAAYFGVGQNRISELALQDGCKFVLFVGNKKLIKRKKFEEFLDEQYAI